MYTNNFFLGSPAAFDLCSPNAYCLIPNAFPFKFQFVAFCATTKKDPDLHGLGSFSIHKIRATAPDDLCGFPLSGKLIDLDVIAYYRGLTHNDACSVVDKEILSDGCTGMDIDTRA